MLCRSFAVLALLTVTCALCPAEVLTFEFTGALYAVGVPLPDPVPDYLSLFHIGDPVFGRFTYEPGALPGTISPSPAYQEFGLNYPTTSALQLIVINGFSFISDPIANNMSAMRYSGPLGNLHGVDFSSADLSDPVTGTGFTNQGLRFFDDAGTLLDDTLALPSYESLLVPRSQARSSAGYVEFIDQDHHFQTRIFFSLDSFTQVQTPEPATWICATVGFILIVLRRRP